MRRAPTKTIATLAAVLAVAALVPATSVAQPDSRPFERTATEFGQAVGEPGDPGQSAGNALSSRTTTELAQNAWPSAVLGGDESGFRWGDAAIGAGTMLLALTVVGLGGFAALRRRGGASRRSLAYVVSRLTARA